MKQTSLVLLILGLFSCSNISKEEQTNKLNIEIDNWHKDATNADFESYFDFIAEEGVFIGTDKTERWSKKEFSEFSKPYFDKGKAWSFYAKERTIRFNKSNTFAWFDEVLDTWMGDCRSTGIASYNGTEWKLEHYQLSVTIDNALMPEFLKITEQN
tara:strand:+ start:1229 stop:1696 length:468 start_codon:yes stop_codon:yes gene_type:complete